MEINEYGEVVNAKEGVCPNCGSEDLDYGVFELYDVNLGYYPVTCNKCNLSFEETYIMKFSSQDNVDDSECSR